MLTYFPFGWARIAAFITLIGLLQYVNPALAAPAAIDCAGANATITAPRGGSTVSLVVQVRGSASVGGGIAYVVAVSPTSADSWFDINGKVQGQVTGGTLATWDSTSVPDGAYRLRLRVLDATGNYCEAFANNIVVQNSSAPVAVTEIPTVTPAVTTPVTQTPIPAATLLPGVTPQALGTVAVPTSFLSAGTATRLPSATGTSGAASADSSTGSILPGFDPAIVTNSAGDFVGGVVDKLMWGIKLMASALLLLGIVVFLRHFL